MADANTTKKLLRDRFREVCAERDAIRDAAAPARAARDALQGEVDALVERQRALAAEFKKIEAPLFDLDNEIAALARALKNETADPADKAGA